MNNEEKILEILSAIQADVSKLNERQDRMDARQDTMEEILTKVAVTQENVVLPRLDMLAQGQKDLTQQIKSLSVVDAMQQDIVVLKAAVKYLSQELEGLKAAN